jgi:hypothetical protein
MGPSSSVNEVLTLIYSKTLRDEEEKEFWKCPPRDTVVNHYISIYTREQVRDIVIRMDLELSEMEKRAEFDKQIREYNARMDLEFSETEKSAAVDKKIREYNESFDMGVITDLLLKGTGWRRTKPERDSSFYNPY